MKKLNVRQQRFVDFYLSGMSATEAYKKAGYKAENAHHNVWQLMAINGIGEIIETRKAEISKVVDDKIALLEEEAILGILNIARNGENDFAKLKAWQDILDRRRGKAKQQIDSNVDMTNNEQYTIIVRPASEALGFDVDNNPVSDK